MLISFWHKLSLIWQLLEFQICGPRLQLLTRTILQSPYLLEIRRCVVNNFEYKQARGVCVLAIIWSFVFSNEMISYHDINFAYFHMDSKRKMSRNDNLCSKIWPWMFASRERHAPTDHKYDLTLTVGPARHCKIEGRCTASSREKCGTFRRYKPVIPV